jgi:UDP-N-acetylglucosamine acyltransferase
MGNIHPTAVIAHGAEIAATAIIGPFCAIGPKVVLGEDVELISHVAVAGITKIGARTRIFPFASIGHAPQDKKFGGEASSLVIGEDNVIREGVTMNPGTEGGGMVTRVGSRGLFMAGVHVGHDCQVGDDVILANNATLAGHVMLGDFAALGGLSAVHQFCRIGKHAFVGGMTGVERDVIPYGMVIGDRARLVGLNLRGLQRRGFAKEEIQHLRAAYAVLFSIDGTLAERLEEVSVQFGGSAMVMDVVDFIRADSSRAIVQPEAGHGAA